MLSCRKSPTGSNPHLQNIRVSQVTANVVINEQVATTTLLIDMNNATKTDQRAELLIPIPAGASIKGFTFNGDNEESDDGNPD